MRNAAPGRPRSAVNDDNRGTRAGGALNIRVEREVVGIRNVRLDSRHDVIAVRVAQLERWTGLKRTSVDRQAEDERGHRHGGNVTPYAERRRS
jgi:hypothetical protein